MIKQGIDFRSLVYSDYPRSNIQLQIYLTFVISLIVLSLSQQIILRRQFLKITLTYEKFQRNSCKRC